MTNQSQERDRTAASRGPVGLAIAGVGVFAFALAALADTPQTFRFDPPPAGPSGAATVAVAGSFNGWSRDATPMLDADGDGTFEVTLPLADGVHFYKFVVDGHQWLNDPAGDAELQQGDGLGGVNSAVLVGPDARKLPPPRPNHVNRDAVLHDPNNPTDASLAGSIARLRVRTQKGDVEKIEVIPEPFGPAAAPIVMQKVGTEMGFDVFAVLADLSSTVVTPQRLEQLRNESTEHQIAIAVPMVDAARYSFRVHDGGDVADVKQVVPDAKASPLAFSLPLAGQPAVPAWPRDAIWYQVFPERFRNGEPANDPPNTKPWTSDWWATLEGEAPGPHNFYAGEGNVWRRRYGGDLQGLQQQLPYLRELGITALYLTPIFEAESSHKYEATDHRHVDDNFGIIDTTAPTSAETDDPATWRWTASDRLFLDFLDEAHAQGFRVVIDGVFNHVGVAHFAFQDVLRNGRDSRYAGWFEITDWGDPAKWGREPLHEHHGKPGGIQWKAWDRDNGDLPVFRKDEALGLAPGPREHILAVTERWTRPVVDGVERRGVDGWRLDVPHDVPMTFWRDWRTLVKTLNPDAYIVGEVWGDATVWVKGDTFDATMNYPFAMTIERFFVDRATATTPSAFAEALTSLYMGYPLSSSLAMQNLLVSHDTERLASLFRNPDRNYDQQSRLQDGANYDTAKPGASDLARMKQALVVQYLFPGAPMTYYGDEAGMWGPDDPSNRMPMVWPDLGPYDGEGAAFDDDLFAWYRRLAAIRRFSPAIPGGFFRVTRADDGSGLVVFMREMGEDRVAVIVNRSPNEVRWSAEEGEWRNLLDPAAATVVAGEGGRPALRLTEAPPVRDVRLGGYETAVLILTDD